MTDKNKSLEIVAVVVAGLGSLWTSYKRTASHTHRTADPMNGIFDALFGPPEMDDVTAAKCLVKDISEITNTVRNEKTKRQFDKIIDKSM